MEVEVVSLGERSTDEVLRWTIADRSRAITPHWRHLALDLVRRARSGQQRTGEVYLCYRGERVEEYFDYDLLQTLIALSREHAWGASIHIVLDSRDPIPETISDCRDSLEEWFRTALRMKVADFLQVRIDPSGLEPVDPLLLRAACDRARSIAESLGGAAPDSVWEVALAGEGKYQERCRDFLASFVRSGGPARPEAHLLILVHDHGGSNQRSFVEEALRLFQPGRATVATVAVRPETALWEYCQSRNLGLAWFRGLYELKYFLLRSSSGGRTTRGEPPKAPSARCREDEFTYYEHGLQEVFRRIERTHPSFQRALVYGDRLRGTFRKTSLREDTDTAILLAQRAEVVDRWNELALASLGVPFESLCEMGAIAASSGGRVMGRGICTLLVTTSLNPVTQEELCLLAARITARLLEKVPSSVVPLVHLAITRSALGDMIDGMPAIAGWIFLGLAAGERGLQEASSTEFVHAEEWSACFGGLRSGFPLALFLAGQSAEAARQFADSGVAACAVGFEGPVLAEDFAWPARSVLQAVLNGHRDRNLIESIMHQSPQGGAFFAEDQ